MRRQARRARRGRGSLAAAAAAVCLAAPQAASAHTELLRSTPPDGGSVAASTRTIRLEFSKPVVRSFSTVAVSDLAGRPVAGARVRAGAGADVLEVELPALRRGVYTADWKVLSADDGHVVSGGVVFGLGVPVAPGRHAAPAGPAVAPLDALLRWANLAALGVLVGAIVVGGLVLAEAGAAVAGLRRRLLAAGAWGGAVALVAGAALLLRQASLVASGDFSSALQLVGETRWGRLWLAREALVAALTACVLLLRLARDRRRIALWAAASALVPALAAVQALGGHAAAAGSRGGIAVVADALHLLAASVWVGALLALVVAFASTAARIGVPPGCLRRLGLLAAGSVAVLATTGLYSAGRQVASLDALLTTLYGRALLVKTALVLVAGVFGLLVLLGLHRRRPVPQRRLSLLVASEALAGLLVLAAVGVMTAAAPARGPRFDRPAKDVDGSLVATSGDLFVTLTAKPNRPGANVVDVGAVSMRRPAPAPVERVVLAFRTPEGGTWQRAMMREVEPGHYRLGGRQLRRPGRWAIEVRVERRGLHATNIDFALTVGPAGGPARVVVSDRPLAPILTRAAAALALALVAAAGLALVRRRAQRPPRPVPIALGRRTQ